MNIKQLLYSKYRKQEQYLIACKLMSEQEFFDYISEKLNDMECIMIEDNGNVGILYYQQWQEEKCFCSIPVYGYYAEDEKMMCRLFKELASRVVMDNICEFSVNLYSYDAECIQAYHMMQFGNMAEKCIKKIENERDNIVSEFNIKVLTKSDILHNWNRIWELTEGIIKHLQNSPVFYPGNEFTEELYRDFYMSEETEVIVAYDKAEIIGMIEWNKEANMLMCGENSVNVGEIYVMPQYRGTKLSEQLLNMAIKRAKEAGHEYMWVEHGTANPNARGFWNKYFETYQYELTRVVNM